MSIFKYYSSLRSDILEIITGVENSGSSLFWDDTPRNWVTKGKLEKIYKKYLKGASQYGLYVVTRHCSCPNPGHDEYPVSNEYGLKIRYKDDNFVWNGGHMYMGERYCVCPCSPENKFSENNVIDDINANQERCVKLEVILYDLIEAIGCAGDKKSRSAIRENLLRAVLRINDQLLPVPMDTYIQKILEDNS